MILLVQRKFSIKMSSLGFLNCFIRNRFLLVKLAVLGLLLYGAVLFLFQYHELMERVRQLESEKMLWKKEKEVEKHLPSDNKKNEGKEKLNAKISDEVKIGYSQVIFSCNNGLLFLISDFNEVLASFLSKLFNHQIVGTDTNKYRLMILHYDVSLL